MDLATYFEDPDKDIIGFNVSQPQDIAATVEGSTLTLTPDPDFYGENELTIIAYDAQGASAESSPFTLRVLAERARTPLGVLKLWCRHTVLFGLMVLAVIVLLIVLTIKERKPRKDNVLVVVQPPKRPGRPAARAATRTRSPRAQARATPETGVQFVGSTDGNKVHAPDCIVAARIPKSKRVAHTKKSALSAGLVPCKMCKPF
jgi:hypothetical protein